MFYRIKSSSSHYWCTWVEWFSSLRTVSSLESIISLILRRSNPFLTGFVMPPDSFSQSVGFCGSRWPFNGSLLWCQCSRSALATPYKAWLNFPKREDFSWTTWSRTHDMAMCCSQSNHISIWVPGVWIPETKCPTQTRLHLWFYLSNFHVNIQSIPPKIG